MTLPAGWYRPVPAPSHLDRWVACSWTATPSGPHRLVPDGCIDLLRLSDGRLVLCGPESRGWVFELPSGTTAVGIRFRPGVAPRLFDFDASTIHNEQVPFPRLVGHDLAEDLADRLDAALDDEERRERLETWVAIHIEFHPVDTLWSDAVIDALVSKPSGDVAAIARHLGWTTRQLHRRSQVCFGYGAKVLDRLLRFQRFLALAVLEPNSGLSRLAAAAGYSDQAHLSRDCRAITGLTPSTFLAEYFPTFPDMSDPFKTVSPLIDTMGA